MVGHRDECAARLAIEALSGGAAGTSTDSRSAGRAVASSRWSVARTEMTIPPAVARIERTQAVAVAEEGPGWDEKGVVADRHCD